MRRFCILAFSFLFLHKIVAATDSLIVINPATFTDSVDLVPHVFWCEPLKNIITFEEAKLLKFKPFEPSLYTQFEIYTDYWFQITLKNSSDTMALNTWMIIGESNEIQLYADSFPSIRNGENIPYFDRVFRENSNCLPIVLSANTTRVFYLRLALKYKPTNIFKLYLQTDKAKKQSRLRWLGLSNDIILFRSLFHAILLLAALLTLGQFIVLKDKAFLYYALFLTLNNLFYLRGYEGLIQKPILFAFLGHFMNFEAPLSYLAFMVYLLFLNSFLDVSHRSAPFSRFIRGSLRLMTVFFIVDIFLQNVFGLKESFFFLNIIRVVLLGVSIQFMYLVFFKLGSRRGMWLGTGTLIVVVGTLVTAFENFANADFTIYYGGLIRRLDFWDTHFYFYDMKTALLIEVFCFYIALNIKIRADRNAKLAVESLAVELTNERDLLQKQLNAATEGFQKTKDEGKTPENDFILRGSKIVEQNLANDQFSADEFAQLMNMSRSAFSIKWKRETGETPADYIKNRRFDLARTLLLTTDLTISQISERCGFKEASHFTNSFSKKFEMTPTEFRRLKR